MLSIHSICVPNFSVGLLIGAALCLGAVGCQEAPSGASEMDPADVWEMVSVSRFNDANMLFERLAASEALDEGAREEARFGQAVTLLEVQPKTSANIDAARGLLAELGDTAKSDDIAASSLYYLGRVYEMHAEEADPELARERYRRLIERFPQHALAEDAVVKLALQELWHDAGGKPSAEQARRMERWLEYVERANSRADLHLALGDAWLRSGVGREQALAHFRAVLEWDGLPVSTRGDALCIVGNLSRELGRIEEGVAAFQQFLDENPFSARLTLVRETMEAMMEEQR